MRQFSEKQRGILLMLGAYVLWGLFPIYWKLIDYVPALEVLCHRVIWCLVSVLLLILFTHQTSRLKLAWEMLRNSAKKTVLLILAAAMLNINWLTYIWSVQNGHIVESSMGYYINPLVSVLLGVIFLQERLSGGQKLAFFIAFSGVLTMAVYQGKPPWISIGLALSFGMYGLLKKKVGLDALSGLTMESGIMAIFAVPWLVYLMVQGESYLFSDLYTTGILLGAGPVTLIPLLLFSAGILLLPLSVVGFLQYLNPTMQLLLGVCLYQEQFTPAHAISFGLIWLGVFIFTIADARQSRALEKGKQHVRNT